MIHTIYSSKDATLYQEFPTMNTGIDEILELTKVIASAGDTGSIENTRILVHFDLTDVSESVASGEIIAPSYELILHAVEGRELPETFEVQAYPVSQSWSMGLGRRFHSPVTTDGVSWKYRKNNISWVSQSLTAEGAGGTWYSGSGFEASQSFQFEDGDIRMDVTDIVNNWISGSVTNDGFILKRSDLDEISLDRMGSLKFFSNETHTIYVPKLQVKWDNQSFITGSLTSLDDENIVIYTKGMRKEYNEESKTRIRIVGRSKYPPTKIFATSSAYQEVKYLPETTFWSVRDSVTDEVLIPFDDNYTKVSSDAQGNYFDFWASGFQVERYYRFLFKVVRNGSTDIYDNGFYFRVTR